MSEPTYGMTNAVRASTTGAMSIADLGRSIQRNVKQSAELMTGQRVVEVNVAVDDVCLPAPGERDTRPSRVS